MHKFLLPAIAAVSLAVAPAAFAAQHAKTTSAPAAAKTSPDKAKTAGCQKEWKAQKKHSQTHKAFMEQCEARV